MQCQSFKIDGKQCTRTAKKNINTLSLYCWQHLNQNQNQNQKIFSNLILNKTHLKQKINPNDVHLQLNILSLNQVLSTQNDSQIIKIQSNLTTNNNHEKKIPLIENNYQSVVNDQISSIQNQNNITINGDSNKNINISNTNSIDSIILIKQPISNQNICNKHILNNNQRQLFTSAINFAIKYGNYELESLLKKIQFTSNFDLRNNFGQTALMMAIKMNMETLLSLLIQIGFDLNTSDYNGQYSLHIATILGNPKIVLQLIDAGANLEVKDPLGLTALHKAILYHQDDIIGLFLYSGANLSALDIIGRTPAKLVKQYGTKKALLLLKNAGIILS
jgi:ankyrin repeat protein